MTVLLIHTSRLCQDLAIFWHAYLLFVVDCTWTRYTSLPVFKDLCDILKKKIHFSYCDWIFPSFIDLNDDVVTFTKSQFSYLDLKVGNDPRLLDATILLSFRTKMHQGLLFYLYDDLNNFVQLEIKTGFRLVLSFNQFQTIRTLEVKIPGRRKMSES